MPRPLLVAVAFALAVGCSASDERYPGLSAAAAGAGGSASGFAGSALAAGSSGRAGSELGGSGGSAGGGDGGSGPVAGQGGSEPGGAPGASGVGGATVAGTGGGSGGKAGTGGKAPTFCEPGEVSACFCADGASGVNQCNANGSALGPCVCQPKPPTCSKQAGLCPDGRDFYDCPPGATLPVPGCLQFQGIATFYRCGAPKPATCDPKRTTGEHLASSKTTKAPEERWTLPASSAAWLSSGDPANETSAYVGVGVGSSPIELGAVEVCIGFVCSNGTIGAKDCITGDKVAREGVQMCCVVGDRHSSGKLPQTTLTCDHGSTVVRIQNKTATCRDLTVTIVN